MHQVQMVFDRVQETKKDKKAIEKMIKEALAQNKPYQDILEQMLDLNLKKKAILAQVMSDYQAETNKIDNLNADIKNDQMLMSDAAWTALMKGEAVEVKDGYGNKYEPVVTVKFKKIS
jgi:hypothetical protein